VLKFDALDLLPPTERVHQFRPHVRHGIDDQGAGALLLSFFQGLQEVGEGARLHPQQLDAFNTAASCSRIEPGDSTAENLSGKIKPLTRRVITSSFTHRDLLYSERGDLTSTTAIPKVSE
jgi:hypothetical protein